MSASTGWPALVLSRYFLSQMSADAGCIGISLSPWESIFTARRVFLPVLILSPLLDIRPGSTPRKAPVLGYSRHPRPQDVVATQGSQATPGMSPRQLHSAAVRDLPGLPADCTIGRDFHGDFRRGDRHFTFLTPMNRGDLP